MAETWLYKLFGIGKILKKVLPMIQRDGILIQEEGIGGRAILRNFRAPGKRYSYRSNWFTGSIVLTGKHFLAFQFAKPVIGIPWTDDRLRELDCSLMDNNKFCVKFDASLFNKNWSGKIEVRFNTSMGKRIMEIIEQQSNKQGTS